MRDFTFTWPCIVTNFFVIKPTRCTNFTNLFCHETLHVSDSSSVHHQEFIHCTLNNGICHTAFEQEQDGTAVPSCSCSKAVYNPAWHNPLLNVQWINSWWWTDELSETCRVSWQNKFVKLVHLVGFITKKFVEGDPNFARRSNKVSFWLRRIRDLGLPTKQNTLLVLKYSHWPKCAYCCPQ